MLFLKKFLLGLGALVLILAGGSGTQSSNMILQGGGFIGLIIGLIALYIFTKMAWRAMGCLPSFIVVIGIVVFILYAIGAFNNGIGGVGRNLQIFLGRQQQAIMAAQQQADNRPLAEETELAPALDENFGSSVGENAAYEQPQAPAPVNAPRQEGNMFQQLMSSLGGGQAGGSQEMNPAALPTFNSAARVINGDTLQIQGRYFKLYGIDAPEANQTCADKSGRSYNCGRQAALWLKGWIGDNILECRIMQQDSKGNMVGTCSLDEYDLGAALVNAGWAFAYTKYTDIYVPYEQQAQANGNGLWQGKFYKPWDWRALQAQKPKIKVIKPKKRRQNFFGM